jgi:hypothetical protein
MKQPAGAVSGTLCAPVRSGMARCPGYGDSLRRWASAAISGRARTRSVPVGPQLRFAHAKKPECPGEKTFRNRFGGHREMFQRLRDWVGGKPDYADVQAILSHGGTSRAAIRSEVP